MHPKEAILEAAMRLFSKRGYPGTSMRDIAQAVGMLPGSLYAHISGKEQMLAELVDSGIERFLALGNLLAPDMLAEFRLRTLIKAHVAIATENPARALVVFHQWRFLGDDKLPGVAAKRRQYQRIFEDIVNDGIGSGQFRQGISSRIAVFTILGALNWTPEWYSPREPVNAEELGEKIADYLICGICRRD